MSDIKLFGFEKSISSLLEETNTEPVATSIEEKYNKGISRVVTETGSYKVNLLKDIFSKESNYNLEPEYQRRITWNYKKRSKLIESLIMNIPIPPIYLFEKDYNQYEIMDGLQRVTAIIDFYNDEYALTGLEEWSELNGKRYSKLDKTIKEGIDRRQLSVITLLKETALDTNQSEKIKRLVFERLNTGGVKLTGQEIRNAILNGPGNDLCKTLSSLPLFRELWEMPESDLSEEYDSEIDENEESESLYSPKQMKKLKVHSLYKRMGDVEIVLRYFAMRHVDEFVGSLVNFLDCNLKLLNTYNDEQLFHLKESFTSALGKAKFLFGTYAFKLFKEDEWTSPLRMIYDPLMIALSGLDLNPDLEQDVDGRVKDLKDFYTENEAAFFGKMQTKEYILDRLSLFTKFLTRYELK